MIYSWKAAVKHTDVGLKCRLSVAGLTDRQTDGTRFRPSSVKLHERINCRLADIIATAEREAKLQLQQSPCTHLTR
jgi:hypothetical protein